MAQTRNGSTPCRGPRHSQKHPSGSRSACSTRCASTMPAASASSSTSRTQPSHKIVQNGLSILENLEHRGAVGADPLMGDGAGIMVQIPHEFFAQGNGQAGRHPARARPLCRRLHLHAAGRATCASRWSASSRRSSRTKARPCSAGATCRPTTPRLSKAPEIVATEPFHRQVIIGRGDARRRRRGVRAQALHHPQGAARPRSIRPMRAQPNDFYVVSMSCRTLVYKGMFLAAQLGAYYSDLHDPDFEFGARARPPALLDQHLPELAARAPLSLRLPQRRNQHRARQRQLDGGAAGLGQLRPVRRRHPEALADLLSGPVRHRLLRQRARVPAARRLFAAARRDDADPRSLGRQPADGRGPRAPSTSTTPR